jgi:hypothetical protein
MNKALYLFKSSNHLHSDCTCIHSPVALPRPSMAPWEGEGWLFTCAHCQRPFTFARAEPLDRPLEEIGKLDLGEHTSDEIVASWVEQMRLLLGHIKEGREYVFFDGSFLPTHAHQVSLEGWFADHDLGVIPQVEAQRNPVLIPALLGSQEYWMDGARQRLLASLLNR